MQVKKWDGPYFYSIIERRSTRKVAAQWRSWKIYDRVVDLEHFEKAFPHFQWRVRVFVDKNLIDSVDAVSVD